MSFCEAEGEGSEGGEDRRGEGAGHGGQGEAWRGDVDVVRGGERHAEEAGVSVSVCDRLGMLK